MPEILDTLEWDRWDENFERMGRAKAYVIEWLDHGPISDGPNVTSPPPVTEAWWSQLRATSDAIAAAPWAGPGRTKRRFLNRVRRHLPQAPGLARVPWVPQHGDFHWANLLSTPDLVIVDWEGYSYAPRGLDAATLLTYSLTHPPTAERVRELFSDVLGGDQGRYVQVYACVSVMTAVGAGFHPELEDPIRDHMHKLVK